MAAPAFVAASSALVADNATPWDQNPAVPTGTAAGDIVFCTCIVGAAAETITPSGSWASIVKITGTNLVAEWFWDRFETGDDTTPNFTSSAGPFFMGMVTYRGATMSGTPYEDATTNGETTSATPASVIVTPTCFESTTICMAAIEDDTVWTTAPPPANWTARMDLASGTGTDARISVIELTTSAAKDANVAAVNIGTISTTEYWATLTLCIKPHSIGPVNLQRSSFALA
jgi:hypothetical protein